MKARRIEDLKKAVKTVIRRFIDGLVKFVDVSKVRFARSLEQLQVDFSLKSHKIVDRFEECICGL